VGIMLLSGFNQRAVIAFCRFAFERNINFYIVAKDNSDTIFLSRYSNYVIDTRRNSRLSLDDFKEWRNKISVDRLMILPSTEYLNRFLLKNRRPLEENGYVIPLCDEELYSEISDKYSFGRLCVKYGIDVPREYAEIQEYPVIAKPKRYCSLDGRIEKPLIVYSSLQRENFLRSHKAEDFYFQEFVAGKSVYLLLYFSRGGEVSAYSQENLIQQDQGLSIIAAISSMYHLEPICGQFKKMFIDRGFSGLVMVEVKAANGRYYMIEANPRLWGPSQLIIDAGMDLFHRFLFDYGMLDSAAWDETYKAGIEYFWLGGMTEDSRNKSAVVFHGGYTQEQFINECHRFMSSEVYLRDDTVNIFVRENGAHGYQLFD